MLSDVGRPATQKLMDVHLTLKPRLRHTSIRYSNSPPEIDQLGSFADFLRGRGFQHKHEALRHREPWLPNFYFAP